MYSTAAGERTLAFKERRLRVSRKKQMIPQHEVHSKTMAGVLPLMSLTPVTSTPDMNVVNKLRDVIATGLKSQKQIGKENGLSQTLMSQYMNRASRVKGWKATDKLLDTWADDFNQQLTKHTRVLTKRIEEERATLETSHQKCGLSGIEYQLDLGDNNFSYPPYCPTYFSPSVTITVDCDSNFVVQEEVEEFVDVSLHGWLPVLDHSDTYLK